MLKRDVDRSVFLPTRASLRLLAALVFCALAMLTPGAPADASEREAAKPDPQAVPASGATPPAPGELAREGLAKMMQALDALVQSVPQYHMPEVTPNGDIIIRRKQTQATPTPTPPPRRRAPPAEKGPGTPI